MNTKKQIKDILPGEKNLQLIFQVVKKVKEQEDSLLCKISDQTGTSDAFFLNPIKKYIQESKVYQVKNAIALVHDTHIRIQLDKDQGTMSKQPIIIQFKDNTYDLSKKAWIKKKPQKKIPESQPQQIQVTKKQETPQNNQEQNQIQKQSSFKRYEKPRNNNSFNNQRRKNEGPYENNKFNRKNRNYEQQDYKSSQASFYRLQQLIDQKQSQYYSVRVHVSKGGMVTKQINKSDKKFYEADLTDETGTIFGSFYNRTIIENGKNYELINMRLRFTPKGEIFLYETQTTEIIPYNKKISKNFDLIKTKR